MPSVCWKCLVAGHGLAGGKQGVLSPWAARLGAATSSLREKEVWEICTAWQEGQSQQPPRQQPPHAQLWRLQLRAAREETSELLSWYHQSVHSEVSSGPSTAWELELALTNIPRCDPSHHQAGEERGQEQTWRSSKARTRREIPAEGRQEQSEEDWSRFWCRTWVTPGLGFSCAHE